MFDGVGVWQGAQDVTQPQIGLDVVGFGGLNQRVDERAGACAGLGVREEPCFSADDEGADGVFGGVVVDWQITPIEVTDQAWPLPMQVAQCVAEHRGRGYGGEHLVEPVAQLADDGVAAALA